MFVDALKRCKSNFAYTTIIFDTVLNVQDDKYTAIFIHNGLTLRVKKV